MADKVNMTAAVAKQMPASEIDSTQLASGADAAQAIDARSLLAGRREAIIMLDGEAYRLRITAREKLILTK